MGNQCSHCLTHSLWCIECEVGNQCSHLLHVQTCVAKSRRHKQMYMHNPAVHIISIPFEEQVQTYVDHGHMLVAICLIAPAFSVLASAVRGVRTSCSHQHFRVFAPAFLDVVMPACKKQKRYVASGLAQGTSLTDLAKHLDKLLGDRAVTETDDTLTVNVNAMSGELHALDEIQTPYGSLTKEFEFTEDDDPTPRTIRYICPFALMHYLADISAVFFEFMRSTFGALGRPAKLFLYADEVTPATTNGLAEVGNM